MLFLKKLIFKQKEQSYIDKETLRIQARILKTYAGKTLGPELLELLADVLDLPIEQQKQVETLAPIEIKKAHQLIILLSKEQFSKDITSENIKNLKSAIEQTKSEFEFKEGLNEKLKKINIIPEPVIDEVSSEKERLLDKRVRPEHNTKSLLLRKRNNNRNTLNNISFME